MDIVQVTGIIAGICTTVAIIPQIVKAFRTKEVGSINPYFFIIMITGVFLWTIYGILKRDWPIIMTNGISSMLNISMLILYFKHK